MQKRRRTLSIDDQKAIDVMLDHTASATTNGLTRVAATVAHHRLTAATKWLSLLAELPNIDPPAGLAERTMKRIDQHNSEQMGHRTKADLHRPDLARLQTH
jgi:hypothetical protein